MTNLTAAAALFCVAAATAPRGRSVPASPEAAFSEQAERPPAPTARAASTQAGSVLFFEYFEQPLTTFVIAGGQAPGPYYGSSTSPSGAYWGRSLARAALGMFSAWCAGSGSGSPSVYYGSNCLPYPYPTGIGCLTPPKTNTTMTTGPFDLSAYASGALWFDVWLSTDVANPLTVQASLDGHTWHGYTYYGASQTQFTTMKLSLDAWPSLGNLAGQPQVWFRFGYASGLTARAEGAFVDNVLLWGLTPTLIFSDGFEDGTTSAWSAVAP